MDTDSPPPGSDEALIGIAADAVLEEYRSLRSEIQRSAHGTAGDATKALLSMIFWVRLFAVLGPGIAAVVVAAQASAMDRGAT